MAMLLQMQVENQKLTQMMFQREARKEQEEQALIQRIEQRDKQRRLTPESSIDSVVNSGAV